MIKKHISKSNAERCRQYRKRLKAKQDLIEQQLNEHIKELKIADKQEITENKGIKISALEANSREPKKGLINQFQNESKQQYNFWGELEGEHNLLDDVSHASNLRKIFGDKHAE